MNTIINTPYTQNRYSYRSLIYLTFLCIILEIIRLSCNNNLNYSFLVWNLALAWVPFGLSNWAKRVVLKSRTKTVLILMIWLLFFPNAPYIITDLLHLKNYSQEIIWFDSLLIFVFAMTGFLISLYSLQAAHQILKAYYGTKVSWLLILFVAFLSGFGIYLGRYCRLNSWDLFNKPLWFFGRIVHQFSNPLTYKITLLYGFVILVVYVIYNDSIRISEDRNS